MSRSVTFACSLRVVTDVPGIVEVGRFVAVAGECTLSVTVDDEDDGGIVRALIIRDGRTHVLGVDNLRAMLGEKAFRELQDSLAQ